MFYQRVNWVPGCWDISSCCILFPELLLHLGNFPADEEVMLSSLQCPEPAEVKSQIKLWDCSQPRGGGMHTLRGCWRDFNCVVFIELAVNTAGGYCFSRAWEPKVYRSQGAVGPRYTLVEISAGLFPAEDEISLCPALPPQLVSSFNDFITQLCQLILPKASSPVARSGIGGEKKPQEYSSSAVQHCR